MSTRLSGETAQIMASLKRLLKARGVTYAQLAKRIGISEPSVKRIFSSHSLTLARLQQICVALDASIQEVARLAGEPGVAAGESLTWDQEAALAQDPKLFACLYLLVNGRNARELREQLAVDERQLRRLFARLNRLGLVELRPNLGARVRKAAALRWRPDGPIRQLYESQVRDEFLKSAFTASSDALHFRSAELSDASCRVLQRKLDRLSTEFRELAELDRSLPSREKRSFAMLLAARPWVFSMFQGISSRVAGDPSAPRRKTGTIPT
jgi:transcriptional regulator with XRE-family HTH domain